MSSLRKIFFLAPFFFFAFSSAVQAGGPSESVALVFCASDIPDDAYQKNIEAYNDIGHKKIRAFVESLETLGRPVLIHDFWMEGAYGGSSLFYWGENSEQRQKRYQFVLGQLEANCAEDISILKEELPRRTEAWIAENENYYGQGSVFVIAPYSKANVKTIKKAPFPEALMDEFPYLKIDVEDGWIFARTQRSFFSVVRKAVESAKIGAIFYLVVYFRVIVAITILSGAILIVFFIRKFYRK